MLRTEHASQEVFSQPNPNEICHECDTNEDFGVSTNPSGAAQAATDAQQAEPNGADASHLAEPHRDGQGSKTSPQKADKAKSSRSVSQSSAKKKVSYTRVTERMRPRDRTEDAKQEMRLHLAAWVMGVRSQLECILNAIGTVVDDSANEDSLLHGLFDRGRLLEAHRTIDAVTGSRISHASS